MRILVTGTRGQVARSIAEAAPAWPGIEVELAGRPELDLADRSSIPPAIARRAPDLVVNAAAYTAVDGAEDEEALAHAVNADGAGAVADAAARLGVPVIHLSTDYVFSGKAGRPYLETDEPGPLNAYGRTKLAGESAVAAANPRHAILRTSWVYSPFGKNFVNTMLDLARGRDGIPVVADRWGNPTSALDVAAAVLHAATRLRASASRDGYGVFHVAGGGSASWSGFAAGIFEISREFGGPWADVLEIDGASYPARAARPADSRLDAGKFSMVFGWKPPPWRDSCRIVVRRLLDEAGK